MLFTPNDNATINYAAPNGVRYPLVGGTRQHRFDGTSLKPQKLPKNAQTPTTTPALACGASVAPAHFAGDRVHAVLASRLNTAQTSWQQ